jgi:poly(3-hydroxybutyrate) depolymerase
MNLRKFLIPALVISLATAGFAQNVTKSFTVNGTTYNCIWHVPSGATKPPVVFFIHGANGSGGGFQNETKGDVVADKEKFIAVYPSATSTGGAGTWADMSGTTNFPFFMAVLDTLDKRYQIDRNRIYMTGFSQGGFISFVAGCKYSDVFAAIAPVSGHAGTSCSIKRPVSVYETFGQSEGAASFIKDINVWLKLNNCPSTGTASKPSTSVGRVTYGPCNQGTYVVMDSILGQGHQWPKKQNQAEEVWAFFKRFTLNNTSAIRKQAPSMARESISASYSSGIVHLHGAGEKSRVRVIDTKGRLVTGAAAVQRQFAFKDKPSGVYVVMMSGNNNRPCALRIIVP